MSDKYLDPIPLTRDKNERRETKKGSIVNTDFLFTALRQQIENNTKLVHIVVELTHKLEQAAIVIDGLNRTIEFYEKGEGT